MPFFAPSSTCPDGHWAGTPQPRQHLCVKNAGGGGCHFDLTCVWDACVSRACLDKCLFSCDEKQSNDSKARGEKAFSVPIGCEVAQPKLNERGSAPLFVAYSEHEDHTPKFCCACPCPEPVWVN